MLLLKIDTTDEDDAVLTTQWNETSDIVDEEAGNFSRFRISEKMQTKLRGLYRLQCLAYTYVCIGLFFILHPKNTRMLYVHGMYCWLILCKAVCFTVISMVCYCINISNRNAVYSLSLIHI